MNVSQGASAPAHRTPLGDGPGGRGRGTPTATNTAADLPLCPGGLLGPHRPFRMRKGKRRRGGVLWTLRLQRAGLS